MCCVLRSLHCGFLSLLRNWNVGRAVGKLSLGTFNEVVQFVDGELERLGRGIKLSCKLPQSANHALRYHVGSVFLRLNAYVDVYMRALFRDCSA